MSLDREDVRCRLDPPYKRAMQKLCEVRGLTEAEYVESLIVAAVEAAVHDAHAIASAIPSLGKTATRCDRVEGKGK